MKHIRLNYTLIIYTVILIIISITGSGFIWLSLEYSRFGSEISDLRDNYINQQKEKVKQKTLDAFDYVIFKKNQAEIRLKELIKNRTLEAHRIATYLYNKYKNNKSKKEISRIIHDALYAAAWDEGKGYYFAESMTGVELINRNNPEQENTLKTKKSKYNWRSWNVWKN